MKSSVSLQFFRGKKSSRQLRKCRQWQEVISILSRGLDGPGEHPMSLLRWAIGKMRFLVSDWGYNPLYPNYKPFTN